MSDYQETLDQIILHYKRKNISEIMHSKDRRNKIKRKILNKQAQPEHRCTII